MGFLILAGTVDSRVNEAELGAKQLTRDEDGSPYIYKILPDNGSIKINSIREMISMAYKKRAIGNDSLVVIIHEAQLMTLPSQNALLKILEEPPAQVHFILTADRPDGLLPTIRSRVQARSIRPVSFESFRKYFLNQNLNQPDVKRLFNLSGGLIEYALQLNDDKTLEMVNQITSALKRPLGHSLIEIQKNIQSRSEAKIFVEILTKLSRVKLIGAQNRYLRKSWCDKVDNCLQAHTFLNANVNTKLVIDNLMLQYRTR